MICACLHTVTVTLDSPAIIQEDYGNIVVTVTLNTPNLTDSTLVNVRTVDSSTTGKILKFFFNSAWFNRLH